MIWRFKTLFAGNRENAGDKIKRGALWAAQPPGLAHFWNAAWGRGPQAEQSHLPELRRKRLDFAEGEVLHGPENMRRWNSIGKNPRNTTQVPWCCCEMLTCLVFPELGFQRGNFRISEGQAKRYWCTVTAVFRTCILLTNIWFWSNKSKVISLNTQGTQQISHGDCASAIGLNEHKNGDQ